MTTTQRIIQDVYQGHEGRAAAPSGTSARADPLWRVVQAWYNRCLGGERSKRFCALLPGGLPLPESGFLLRSEKTGGGLRLGRTRPGRAAHRLEGRGRPGVEGRKSGPSANGITEFCRNMVLEKSEQSPSRRSRTV